MSQQPQPVYLLAGGRGSARKKQDTLLQAVFRGIGIKSPKVAYSGTASGDDREFFRFISSSFADAGAGKVTHAVLAPDDADVDKGKRILREADVIFVSGGDVEFGMKVLKDKNLLDFFNELYYSGKPFFGISAGAIMLAQRWVRWTDPDDDKSADLFPCLGYAPIICDTHDEAAGWEELHTALGLAGVGAIGYGLASGSGVKVMPDGKVLAIGGTVYRYEYKPNGVQRMEDVPVTK